MAVNLSPYGGVGAQFLDNAGNVLTGGKIFTYAAGTTTNQATYTNSTGTVAHSNPIVLDASGRVPSGEIWLSDGLQYKFVLKDSNDVLIATYDNIVGINSNFVAFTNQQEIQTATAGQTVFNLTTMTYQPNTNSLSVFVDGVNQYGPGSSYAYLETDSDTVTFVSGLHVGAEVKFTTSNLNSSTSGDAFSVSYLPPFTGAAGTNVGDKLAQTVSVLDFGADPTGVIDSTIAFSNAAKAVTASVLINGAEANILRAPSCEVIVPPGTYTLGSLVDVDNKDVLWVVERGASISDYNNLNGRLSRPGNRVNTNTFGTTDYAAGFSVRANASNLNDGAEVVGISSPSSFAVYPDRDSVGMYVDNKAPAVLANIATATYTTTRATLGSSLNATQLEQLRVGMIVDTLHSPKWSGFITSWASNGSYVEVSEWVQFGGTSGTPASGTGLVINGTTKIWAHNANVQLDGASFATKSTGFELGNLNNQNAASQTWGFDSVNLGTYKGSIGMQVRNDWIYGFAAIGTSLKFCDVNFFARGAGALLLGQQANQVQYFSVNSQGAVEMGSLDTTRPIQIDFHSSGTTADYDCRIQSVGGTSTAKNGSLRLSAASINSDGTFRPLTDNAFDLGDPTFRWKEVYAVAPAINTSDARQKQQIRNLTDAEHKVALEIKKSFKAFKFNHSVDEKGDKARIHIGVIAQQIAEIFTKNGLNPDDYSLFCYDKWEAKDAILNEDGTEAMPAVEAGDRYGIRYEELLAFVISAL